MPTKPKDRLTPLPRQKVRGSRSGRRINVLLDLLGRSKAMRVIWELRNERSLRFRDLADRCEASPSVLNTRIKELRAIGIVDHTRTDGYCLTSRGNELLGHFLPFFKWAREWEEAS